MGSSRPGRPYVPPKLTEAQKEAQQYGNFESKKQFIDHMYESDAPVLSDKVRAAKIGEQISSVPLAAADPLQRQQLLRGVSQAGQEASLASSILEAERENRVQDEMLKDINRRAQMDQAQGKSTAAKIGAGAQAVGSAISLFSDETVKTDILEIEGFTKNFLATLKPYTFKYAEDVGMGGKIYGVMAQDLEKTNIGSTLVFEHEGKKAVDVPRTVSLLLAVIADLNSRLKKLEEQ